MALACRCEHLKRNWLPKAAIFLGHLDVGNPPHRGPKSRPMVLVLEPHARPVFPRREREPGRCLFAKLQIQLRFQSESRWRFGILWFSRPGDGIRCGVAATAPDFPCD